eukprot:5273030-Pyramimonas_sp.AAC.1
MLDSCSDSPDYGSDSPDSFSTLFPTLPTRFRLAQLVVSRVGSVTQLFGRVALGRAPGAQLFGRVALGCLPPIDPKRLRAIPGRRATVLPRQHNCFLAVRATLAPSSTSEHRSLVRARDGVRRLRRFRDPPAARLCSNFSKGPPPP